MPAWPPTIERDPPAPERDHGLVDVTEETIAPRAQVASIRDYLNRRAHLQPQGRPDSDPPEAA